MNLKNFFLSTPSYLEQKDPMLMSRISIVWANAGSTQPQGHGVQIQAGSYLLGLIDAFSMAGEKQAAQEVSFLLELHHRKLMEQQRHANH